jgi:hypothetical protein
MRQYAILKNMRRLPTFLLCCLFLFLLPACGGRPMQFKNVAKSDIDLVADAHLQEMLNLMKELMIKLYKRNPKELGKHTYSREYRLAQLFSRRRGTSFPELNYKNNTEALQLCFDENFTGDRVFALMTGLSTMIRQAYNNQDEFFIFDSLDQQKLYNSARNIEILVWRLSHNRNSHDEPFLLTNEQTDNTMNLSYERLFGKMIAVQDMMARIVADRTNRAINHVVHTAASAAFLP